VSSAMLTMVFSMVLLWLQACLTTGWATTLVKCPFIHQGIFRRSGGSAKLLLHDFFFFNPHHPHSLP
jgi:hypothetical protein